MNVTRKALDNLLLCTYQAMGNPQWVYCTI